MMASIIAAIAISENPIVKLKNCKKLGALPPYAMDSSGQTINGKLSGKRSLTLFAFLIATSTRLL